MSSGDIVPANDAESTSAAAYGQIALVDRWTVSADEFGDRFRMTAGNIRRAAAAATTAATVAGRDKVTLEDVAGASRNLRDRSLEALQRQCQPVAAGTTWSYTTMSATS